MLKHMLTKEEILQEMLKKCAAAGFVPTDNAPRIAQTKSVICKDDWKRCPCDKPKSERFCISDLCKSDIERDGICHCRCYKKS